MSTASIWRRKASQTYFPTLQEEITTEVVVIGGGITGVTLALNLAEQGRSVVLLEARNIGSGSTGNSTGNLYETVSHGIHAIVDRWDSDVARTVTISRRHALKQIESRAEKYEIDCGFRRCSLYRYATSDDAKEFLEREYSASLEAALPVRREEKLPFPLLHLCGPVVVLENQAQFDPHAYVSGLARISAGQGCRIFENARVVELDMGKRIVYTEKGKVNAKEIVLATHSPVGFHLVQAEMIVNREYGIAARVERSSFPPGIFWEKGIEQLSIRKLEVDQQTFLISVGGAYKTGQEDATVNLDRLEAATRTYFKRCEIAFRWSAQNYRAADDLPYIGRDASGCFVATGFQTDGLVYGTLAAAIIADEIGGNNNVFASLYKADRFSPIKGAKGMAEETKGVLTSLVKDYLLGQEIMPLSRLMPNTAAMVEFENETLAVYRDKNGRLYAVSPVCTHLKCKVHWNDVESSWDCPCHGSRFAPDGTIIEGPATEPLTQKFLHKH